MRIVCERGEARASEEKRKEPSPGGGSTTTNLTKPNRASIKTKTDIMARFASMPGTIPMHGGLPPADAFPFASLSFALAPPAAGGGGGGNGGGGGGGGGGNHGGGSATTPRSSSSSEEPAVEATIITNGVGNGKASKSTPSPDHRAPKDHGRANGNGATTTTTVAALNAPTNNNKKCRCNAAKSSSSNPQTLTIDNPLTVAAAQQYNIGNYGQAGLRAWAARATAELQRPRAIVGSESWVKENNGTTATTPQQQPGPPPAAVSKALHSGGRDLVVTAGSTAALDAALRALLSRGDALLAEEFTYSHALEALMAPHGYKLIPVRMDKGQGIDPAALDEAARREKERTGTPPKVLYTIPVGQNPTGCVAGMERLERVYAVARKWGMVIIEDDAYCWLRLHEGDEAAANGGANGNGENNHHNPLLPRPGLLSLDSDGRVLRLDTFAKLLAPGLRLGWATGPARLVRVVAEATMAATVGPPALSQVVVLGLLQQWGCCCCVFDDQEEDEEEEAQPTPSSIGPGFRHYLAALQRRYAVQADLAARCASQHLEGVAEFEPPRAGMFLWVRLLPLEVEKNKQLLGVDGDRVVRRAGDLGVAVVPGRIFAVESYTSDGGEGEKEQSSSRCCPYLRVSFVNTPPALVDEGLRRLRRAVDEEREAMVKEVMVTTA
jgi:DNA-binding transcriptional MocR family regulator